MAVKKELANSLKNRAPKRTYHKNFSGCDLIKAFEYIPFNTQPSKKMKGY